MVSKVPPVLKSIFVCDDVVATMATQGKLTILNVFDLYRPADTEPPYVLAKLCVFATLSGVIRDYELQVVVVNAQSREVAFTSPVRMLRIRDRNHVMNVVFRLVNCRFPEAGVYVVELHCDGEFMDDRLLTVIPVEQEEE